MFSTNFFYILVFGNVPLIEYFFFHDHDNKAPTFQSYLKPKFPMVIYRNFHTNGIASFVGHAEGLGVLLSGITAASQQGSDSRMNSPVITSPKKAHTLELSVTRKSV